MKQLIVVLVGLSAGSASFAQTPAIPSFTNEPLSLVPTPMAESSPAELRTLLDAPTPWRKLVTDLSPRVPAKIVAHLTIVEPNPDLQYAMPIVTPDPDVDYKLRIIGPGGEPASETK